MNTRYKYPRTPHLPWSPGVTSDDIRVCSTHYFRGKDVVVTENMDGENTTLYQDYCHARSINSANHVSRDWVKRFLASIKHDIPQSWRICGENLFAEHSIRYSELKSYFYGFSIWNDKNYALSWDDTLEWFDGLDIAPVTTLYRGEWDENLIRDIALDTERVEGYVVRLTDSYSYADFAISNAKWVRKNHVQTDQHWMHSDVKMNGLNVQGESNEN